MNVGERDELIFKIYMTQRRDCGETLFGEPIESVSFDGVEYYSLPDTIDMNTVLNMRYR